MEKTLVMKLLDGKKIAYTVHTYTVDTRDAELVAEAIGIDPAQVYKTLVVQTPGHGRGRQKPILTLIPANQQLNLKLLAKAAGAKKLKLATHKEAEKLTGLQVGGISPLALINKGFTVYLDEGARIQKETIISGGKRGVQIQLAVEDLLKITRARWAAAAGPAGQ